MDQWTQWTWNAEAQSISSQASFILAFKDRIIHGAVFPVLEIHGRLITVIHSLGLKRSHRCSALPPFASSMAPDSPKHLPPPASHPLPGWSSISTVAKQTLGPHGVLKIAGLLRCSEELLNILRSINEEAGYQSLSTDPPEWNGETNIENCDHEKGRL